MTLTKDDIQSIKGAVGETVDKRIAGLEKKMDVRFSEQDKKMDVRFSEQDKKMDVRFSEQDKKMDVRFQMQARQIDTKFQEQKSGILTEVRQMFKEQGEYLSRAIADAVKMMADKQVTEAKLQELENELDELRERVKTIERLQKAT